MTDHDSNDWSEWKQHVLQSLERHEGKIDEVLHIVKQIEIENSAQKVKTGILGSISGGIGAGIVVAIKWMVGGKP